MITDGSSGTRSRDVGIGAAVALVGLLLAFGALLTGTDPGPDEHVDAGAITALLLAGGVIFVVGVVIAAVALVRGLRGR